MKAEPPRPPWTRPVRPRNAFSLAGETIEFFQKTG